MSKLLFCDYQPNGLGIKLVRMAPGVPGGELGRNQTPGNIGPNPPEKQDPDKQALETSRDKEKAAKEAIKQAVELVMISNGDFLTHLVQLREEAASTEANFSAPSVLARIAKLRFRRYQLGTRFLELTQSINNDLHPALEVLNIRTLIREIYEILQELKESPSKPILDDLQLLLMELEYHLEYYCPNEQQDYHPYGNAQLQNKQLAQAVKDANELVITIKRWFPVIIVQTAIKTVNATIDELAIFSPYDNERVESFRLKLLNLLRLNNRYFGPYVSRLGKQYSDNELLIAMQQAMGDINSLEKEIGSSEEEIRQSLMSEPNELKGKLNDLLNNLKNRLANELLPKAEMEINSDNTPFNSLRFGSFS